MNTAKPEISVLMAVYNGLPFLVAQLNSIASQTLLPTELIVCDDCSSDDSCNVVLEFAARAPFPVRLLQNSVNLGYSKTFERCMRWAHGDIVLFSDQDDIWSPGKVRAVVSHFDLHPKDLLLVHDGKLVDANLVWHGACKIKQVNALYSSRQLITGSLSALRQPLLPHLIPLPDGISHDSWMHAIAHVLGARAVAPLVLQLIRRHGRNATNGHSSQIEPFTFGMRLRLRWRCRDQIYWREVAHTDRAVLARLQSWPGLDRAARRRLLLLRWRAYCVERWGQYAVTRWCLRFL